MRLKSIQLRNFKRFNDLTINLGDNPSKIIASVGPNGCGKSSIFDAFEYKNREIKEPNNQPSEDAMFYAKCSQKKEMDIILIKEDGTDDFDEKSFYIRTAYRYSPRQQVHLGDAISRPKNDSDSDRPRSSIEMDNRGRENHKRLHAHLYQQQVLEEQKNGIVSKKQIHNEFLSSLNTILRNVLDIQIHDLGTPFHSLDIPREAGDRGAVVDSQLFFTKGECKKIPYINLSAGEKDTLDIILDLMLKTEERNNAIYCIDTPELHINTSIQRNLLIEIDKLIPDTCQLWIATHSIGFLRALQEELRDKSSVLDFSEKDYFNGTKEIQPILRTRENWQRIFQTALEDLTGLMAPKRIVYCEGKLQNSLDEKLFNIIFGREFHDTLFLSSGNKDNVQRCASIALAVLNKAFLGVEIIALIDRDDDLGEVKKRNVVVQKLTRREFENYLFDKEILRKYCDEQGKTFRENEYDDLVKDIKNDDVKKIGSDLVKKCCDCDLSKNLKVELAELLAEDTVVYQGLRREIFGVSVATE
ncbi:MAG: AAA family ATPase [Candidatus Spechtbacteria bacterium SB0662_bin_43]|uniref:AAA family ATPase n=1 Tax=Candidatus Spechtbacteria bacterium SB0662_bin_43 TaxID=2604897 RepID=A0A845D9G0_9BACT|nr:AAA family ATPase [Candidatus Spechtbacteria bacterium SB0662_bin_43]